MNKTCMYCLKDWDDEPIEVRGGYLCHDCHEQAVSEDDPCTAKDICGACMDRDNCTER